MTGKCFDVSPKTGSRAQRVIPKQRVERKKAKGKRLKERTKMYNLSERLLKFGIDVIKLLRKVPNKEEYKIIRDQLIKSSTSAGANYEEAQGGSSKADFANKVRISLKEMRESNYWLKLTNGINDKAGFQKEVDQLIRESQELKNILGSICSKTNRKDE